jgi:hypothetical protein
MKSIKNLFNNDNNKIRLFGLLTTLITLWLVLYLIPELFVSIFNTLLGNLILLTIFLLTFMYNRLYGIIIGLTLIMLYRFSHLLKEGFTEKSELDFLRIQNTINKQNIFDLNVIQTQATQEELDYFNKNGMWPWSQQTIDLYTKAISKNPFIRTLPEDAVNYTRTIYNQASILRILSYQTKEGQFLLNGVLIKNQNSVEELPSGFGEFPYESGLIEDRTYDIIKCNLSKNSLERKTYTGKGIFGQQTNKIESVDYNHLENIIPDFKFVKSPCNPCNALKSVPDYSCPFDIKIEDKSSFISDVWKTLWNINY